MGIRYYAYGFDAEMTEAALANPLSVISEDPLADAWGMPRGAHLAVTNFEQSVPTTRMLYLDKAWSAMQALTAPNLPGEAPRPAYRMFEGRVTMDGYGWLPWARSIAHSVGRSAVPRRGAPPWMRFRDAAGAARAARPAGSPPARRAPPPRGPLGGRVDAGAAVGRPGPLRPCPPVPWPTSRRRLVGALRLAD